MDTLDEIKKAAGVKNLKKLTRDQLARIQDAAVRGQISLDHLKELTKVVPNFVDLLKSEIDGLTKIAKSASGSQKKAFDAIVETLATLRSTIEILAQNLESDEARLKLAEITLKVGELAVRVGEMVTEMNRDNNSLWKVVAGAAGAAVLALIAIFVPRSGRGS
jgi:hypothetical protein